MHHACDARSQRCIVATFSHAIAVPRHVAITRAAPSLMPLSSSSLHWPPQVTPRDYLETALQPLQGTGRAVEAKNQVRLVGVPCFVVPPVINPASSSYRICLATPHVCAARAPATPQIRESIKSLFPDRDCFTLVRRLRGSGSPAAAMSLVADHTDIVEAAVKQAVSLLHLHTC